MKGVLHRAGKAVARSKFSARVDAVRAESRGEMARKSGEGKAWGAMSTNVALLGLRTDSASRPKMVFGANR